MLQFYCLMTNIKYKYENSIRRYTYYSLYNIELKMKSSKIDIYNSLTKNKQYFKNVKLSKIFLFNTNIKLNT